MPFFIYLEIVCCIRKQRRTSELQGFSVDDIIANGISSFVFDVPARDLVPENYAIGFFGRQPTIDGNDIFIFDQWGRFIRNEDPWLHRRGGN